MGQVKVTTPVPGYTGSVGGVHFVGGEALVDEEAAEMTYLRNAGYHIGEPDSPDVADVEPEPMPRKNASLEAWRNWAVNHGGMPAEEAGELSRDELVARFAEVEENS